MSTFKFRQKEKRLKMPPEPDPAECVKRECERPQVLGHSEYCEEHDAMLRDGGLE